MKLLAKCIEELFARCVKANDGTIIQRQFGLK